MRSLLFAAGWLLYMASVPGADANHVDIKVDKVYRDHFEDTMAVKVPSPTDLEFTPDGKYLFTTEKEGKVWVINVEDMDKDDAKPQLSFKIPHKMCVNGARGLHGIGIHPEYPVKRWVYLFFNVDKYNDCGDDGPVNQLSRFELNDDNTIDKDSEIVFFTTPRLPSTMHNSGDIAFGKDGMLYVTVGDGGDRNLENKDGVFVSQALDMLMGKIVRLTEDGLIPDDNPFTPAMGETKSERCNKKGVSSKPNIKCQEIYATGLRNPYRFAFDPNADGTRFYINDVGRTSWERILECGDGFAAANYGFPFRQGPCESGGKLDKGEKYKGCGPSEFVDPVHWWEHDEEDGGAVTGGAFVPNDIGWPQSFQNAYLYADYAYGGIYRVTPGGKGCPYPKCDPPISDFSETITTFSNARKVVSIQFGPHKGGTALYYLTRDHLGNRGEAAVFRIAYTGNSNRAPKAKALAEPSVGFAPLSVNFDATQSEDPDGDSPLTYEWDFDGDGVTDSTEAQPLHVFTKPGTYSATLTVKDGKGGSTRTTVRVDVDNTPPIPKIISPAEGTTFAVGDVLTLVGMAMDNEEGQLPDTQLTWEVRQHHNTHYHPFLDPTDGNNIELWPAPPPEDFDASTTSYLTILLTATDSTGLSSTTEMIVLPKIVDVTIETDPPGLDIIADGDRFSTPKTLKTWENHHFKVTAPPQSLDGIPYGFASWSNGGMKTHQFLVPAIDPEPLIANYEMIQLVGLKPQILSPASGTTFAVGEKLKLKGSVVDEAGNELPDASLTWEVRYGSSGRSDSYRYFMESVEDNFLEIDAPGPRDLISAKNSFLEVFLTVSNANENGHAAVTSVILEPRTVDVDFDTSPSGFDVVLDGETFTTPVTITTWENHEFNVRASGQKLDGTDYTFAQWSDEGKRSHKYAAISKDSVVADFEPALPKPEIEIIKDNTKFVAGDEMKLKGSAMDSQGNIMPDSSLSWMVRVHNPKDDSYRTVIETIQGNNIKVHAPQPADFDEAKAGHLEITLIATDSRGRSSWNRFIVEPQRVEVVFKTVPSGFFVIADGQQLRTPATITTWENQIVTVEAPRQKKLGMIYAWKEWSDGGAVSHDYRVLPESRRGPQKIVATLEEEVPAETSKKGSVFVVLFACIGVVVLIVIVLIIGFRKKKRGIPIIDMDEMSSYGEGELKNIHVMSDDDASTLRDGSQEDLDVTGVDSLP